MGITDDSMRVLQHCSQDAQRDYFRTRPQRSLSESKQYERQVDAEIERVTKIEQEQAEKQQQKLL